MENYTQLGGGGLSSLNWGGGVFTPYCECKNIIVVLAACSKHFGLIAYTAVFTNRLQ